jgi:hypothetical protein
MAIFFTGGDIADGSGAAHPTEVRTDEEMKKSKQLAKPGKITPAATYKRYVAVVKRLPGVEESTSYGTPSIKVKGKILSRLRTEAEGALAIRCDFIDREILLQSDPETFFLTDHYRNYPMILVRLDKVRADALPDLVERAWRLVAPSKLVAAYDAESK